MGYYLGDTWVEDAPAASNPLLTDPANAAAIAALKAQYGDITPGRLTNYGEGVTGYEGGRTLQNSKYGLYSGGPNGNVVWNGSEWVPVPEAKDGSLFADWAGDIAGFAGAAAGAYGLASGLGSLASLSGAGAGSAGASGSLANTGYIDALGGMTDITGTALPGWSSGAGATAGGLQTLADSGYVDTLGGMGGGTAGGIEGATGASIGAGGMEAGLPAITGATEISPTLLSQLNTALGTNFTGTDVMRTLGNLGAAGLGAYASNEQTGALEDMAARYEGYGAPYRQKLSDLYADPTSFLSSKEVQTPVDLGTQSLMRSLSTQGNPFGSGNALQQGQSYASDQLFSRLGQEKDRLAGFGGLASYNAAAPAAATNAISSGQGPYIGAAKAMGDIFNPPQTPAQQAAEWMKVMGR